MFFANVCVIGGGFSLVEWLLIIALQEIGASATLCGGSVLMTVAFELPIFACSEYLLEKLGTLKMIAIGTKLLVNFHKLSV